MKLGASFDFFLMGFVGFWNLLMEMIGLESLRIKLKQGGKRYGICFGSFYWMGELNFVKAKVMNS